MLYATELYCLFRFHRLHCRFPESLAEIGTGARLDLESLLAFRALSVVETNTQASVEDQNVLQDPAKINITNTTKQTNQHYINFQR